MIVAIIVIVAADGVDNRLRLGRCLLGLEFADTLAQLFKRLVVLHAQLDVAARHHLFLALNVEQSTLALFALDFALALGLELALALGAAFVQNALGLFASAALVRRLGGRGVRVRLVVAAVDLVVGARVGAAARTALLALGLAPLTLLLEHRQRIGRALLDRLEKVLFLFLALGVSLLPLFATLLYDAGECRCAHWSCSRSFIGVPPFPRAAWPSLRPAP